MRQTISLGVFWFIDGRIYGQSETVSLLSSDGNNLAHRRSRFIDTELEHWRVWESSSLLTRFAPLEYFHFSRGRLLYDKKLDAYRVYCDAALLKPALAAKVKAQITAFFGIAKCSVEGTNTALEYTSVSWYSDEHYTTNGAVLNNLFRD